VPVNDRRRAHLLVGYLLKTGNRKQSLGHTKRYRWAAGRCRKSPVVPVGTASTLDGWEVGRFTSHALLG
jgi:hypothetical protein